MKKYENKFLDHQQKTKWHLLKTNDILFMNKFNRIGDKWLPWGVPDETGNKLDDNTRTEVN